MGPQSRRRADGGSPQELKMLRNAPICSRRHSPMGMRYRLESNTCAQQLSSHPKINRKTEQMSASARPRSAGHNAAHTCDVSQSTDSWSNALRYLSITARIAWRAASVSGCTSSSTFVRS
jgi:hypothetical protein